MIRYGGYGSSYGQVYVDSAGPVIHHGTITRGSGGGIYLANSSAAKVTNSVISDNGGGSISVIAARRSPTTRLRETKITGLMI